MERPGWAYLLHKLPAMPKTFVAFMARDCLDAFRSQNRCCFSAGWPATSAWRALNSASAHACGGGVKASNCYPNLPLSPRRTELLLFSNVSFGFASDRSSQVDDRGQA